MTLTAWLAVACIVAVVVALIKKCEVRVTLLSAGIFLCLVSLQPMAAFNQFAKMMTINQIVK